LRGHHRFFPDGRVGQEGIVRVALWKLPSQTQTWLETEVDLVICELSPIYSNLFKNPISFTTHTWINMLLDIQKDPQSLVSGRNRRGLRLRINRAQKNGYQDSFTRSRDDFEFFWDRMYVPFIYTRYGDNAHLSCVDDQWRWHARKGGVLYITHAGKRLVGTLVHLTEETCYGIELGVLDADIELFQPGILTYLAWCTIQWARSQGVQKFDMGGTRAYTSASTYVPKQTWGARVVKRKRFCSSWYISANELSPSLEDLINRLGLITEIVGVFCTIQVISGEDIPVKTQLKSRLLKTWKQGLNGLAVITNCCEPVIYTASGEYP
jgi:hypothetical protein